MPLRYNIPPLAAGSTVITKVTKAFGDFSAAALENDIEIFSLPEGHKIVNVITKHETPFSGTGIVTLVSEVGVSGELDKFIVDQFDLIQAVGDTVFDDSEVGSIESFGAAVSVRAHLIATGANLDQLLAGSVDYYIFYKKVEQ